MQALHSANARWLVADQLGTPRMVVDKTGALSNVKRHDYLVNLLQSVAEKGFRRLLRSLRGLRSKFDQRVPRMRAR